MSVAFVNGTFVAESEASISIFDHAVLYGDGVYDTALAWNGYIFRLDAHLERLFTSLRAIKLVSPIPREELRDVIIETVRRNELRNSYIKCVVTRGVSPEPLMNPRPCVPGVIVFARPYLSQATPEQRARGLRVKITMLRRISDQALPAQVKSLNYLNLVLAKIEAFESGCDEAVMLDDHGCVCEAPGYNVFAVRSGVVRTPARSILLGITRTAVMDLCAALGLPAETGDLTPFNLYTADEVFLSSTAGGLVPVVDVDGRVIGTGEGGPIWRRLHDEYWERLGRGWSGTAVYSQA
jgi:branched-chain amino acid aminotransferase